MVALILLVTALLNGVTGAVFETRNEVSSDALRAFVPTGDSKQLGVQVVGKTRYALFTSFERKSTKIFLRQSDGDSWSIAEQVSPPDGSAFSPSLWVAPNGDFHAVWLADANREFEVVYSKKAAGESSWSPAHVLWKGVDHSNPGITGDNTGTVYIWFSNRESQRAKRKVVLYISRDSGETWQSVEPFGDSVGGRMDLQLVVAGEAMYICWLDVGVGRVSVLFNASDDRGRSWLEKPIVVNENRDLEMSGPILFPRNDGLFILWKIAFASGQSEVWADFTSDGGRTWQGDHQVYVGERTYYLQAAPYASRGRVGALWKERVGNNTWQVQARDFWREGAWLTDSPTAELLTAAAGYKLGELSSATIWQETSAAAITESMGPGPGKVWLFHQDSQGNWHVESLDKLVGRSQTHAARLVYDGVQERLSLFYYESALPRFFGDPWKPESRLFEILITPVVE